MPTTDWIDLNEATGRIETTSPGRRGAEFTKFGDATFYAGFDRSCPAGAQGEWTDASGEWVVTVLVGLDDRGMPETDFDALIVEFYGEEPFLSTDASECLVVYTHLSPAGVAGRAECRGLRWFNGYEASTEPESARPIPGIPPFDVVLQFEGLP